MPEQRIAVVTGASSGIGKETAKALVAQGWRVIGVGRDTERCAAAAAEIAATGRAGAFTMLQADLAHLAEVDALAVSIAATTDRIHVLVNNAGGMANRLVVTPEGYEANFAGNHLGPFLLTHRLLPLLRAAAAGAPAGSVRVIVTSSFASEMVGDLDFAPFVQPREFNGGRSYTSGKLANVLFARGLSQRLAASGIGAHSVAPGPVASNFFSHAPDETLANTRDLVKATEAEGADTLIWLATADEPGRSSGQYWFRRALRPANPLVEDRAFVDRFWAESERLVGLAG